MCIDVKLQLRKINRLMRKLEVYKKEDLQNVQFSFWDAGDCWLLLAAAGCCWQVLSCDAVAFVPSTSKSIGSFSEVAGVANNCSGVHGIQSIDVGVAITASVVSIYWSSDGCGCNIYDGYWRCCCQYKYRCPCC